MQAEVLCLLRDLAPQQARGVTKVRVGSSGDGGYVQLSNSDKIVGAFSCGVSGNDEWDAEMAAMGVPVDQYDGTVAEAPTQHPLLTFHKKMVFADRSPTAVTLADMAAKYPASPEPNLMLKIDIEGAEWDVFDRAADADLVRFRQIVCEFHNLSALSDRNWFKLRKRVLEKLNRLFAPVHLHANNYGGIEIVRNIAVPRHLEVSYANRLCYRCDYSDEIFPTPLDRPCAPFLDEIILGIFKF